MRIFCCGKRAPHKRQNFADSLFCAEQDGQRVGIYSIKYFGYIEKNRPTNPENTVIIEKPTNGRCSA